MKEKVLVREFTFEAEIYDVTLPEKVLSALQADPILIDPKLYYAVDVIFDKASYHTAAFFQYPLDKPPFTHNRKMSEQEVLHEKVSAILSQQLSKVQDAVKSAGIEIGSSAIIGEELADLHRIHVKIFEEDEKEYDKKGKRKTKYIVNSIVPDRPFILKRAVEVFAKMFQEDMAKNARKEHEQATHTPNMVVASTLFTAVAKSILLDSRKAHDANIAALGEELLAHAVLSCDWPLKIEGYKTAAEPITPDFKIDCPEFLLYSEDIQGRWTLEKIEGLRVAQYRITKEGYNKKSTARMSVLQNLKPIGFDLFSETGEGLAKIKKEKAVGEKKLNVSWKR